MDEKTLKAVKIILDEFSEYDADADVVYLGYGLHHLKRKKRKDIFWAFEKLHKMVEKIDAKAA